VLSPSFKIWLLIETPNPFNSVEHKKIIKMCPVYRYNMCNQQHPWHGQQAK